MKIRTCPDCPEVEVRDNPPPCTYHQLLRDLRAARETLTIISKMRGATKNGPWTIAEEYLEKQCPSISSTEQKESE